MPYPNYHACRLKSPGSFSEFRYKKQNGADVVMGKEKRTGEWSVQAIRYPKESWDEARARENCGKHSGRFDAASGSADHSSSDYELVWEGLPLKELDSSIDLSYLFDEVKSFAQTLRDVEIFAVGKWNGDAYTEADLDAIVEAYKNNAIRRDPPLKLGHDDAQKWFGQKDGAPSLGFVANLKRKGQKLLADFVNVPNVVTDLIRNGMYNALSAEIYWGYTNPADPAGKKWHRALKAVSLLGADMPAVTNLQDLRMALLSDNSYAVAYGDSDESEVRTYNIPVNDGGNMDEKRYQEKISSLEAQLGAERERADKMEARAVRAEATLQNRDEDFAVKQFKESILVDLKKKGLVLPSEEESLIITFSALGAGTRKYGDKDVNPREMFVKSLSDRKPQISINDGGSGDDGGDAPPASEVDKRIRKFMDEGKAKTYAEGKELVKSRYPQLWERYIKG